MVGGLSGWRPDHFCSMLDAPCSPFLSGFSIINIVKNNPKELTIYFGGPRGKAIRQNYMSMIFENVAADGSVRSEKIFKEVDEDTTSYTYRSPTGLLSATQFTQPALTLMEKASFEDMRSKGLVQINSSFAGHSLGEYSALAALAEVMPIESLVSVVYYRGLTMQVAVERDATGRSNYSMCAVNPSRISKTFNEQALQYVVENISEETGWLLEIVNYNIANAQYVCAGDLRALDCLTNVTNYLKTQKVDIHALMQSMSLEDVKAHLVEIIRECAKTTSAKATPIDLQRGFATIPLKGIDVPFHSTFLRSGVKPFRNFLLKKIIKTTIDPSKLVGKYIPNVTAKPFELTKEYFEEVYRLTNSPRIGSVLANVSLCAPFSSDDQACAYVSTQSTDLPHSGTATRTPRPKAPKPKPKPKPKSQPSSLSSSSSSSSSSSQRQAAPVRPSTREETTGVSHARRRTLLAS